MVFALLLFAWYAALIFVHSAPPLLSDFQTWSIADLALSKHFRGIPEAMHAVKHYPVPNSTIEVVPALFGLVLSGVAAVRAFLIFFVVVALAALYTVTRATRASPLVWWIVPSACFFGLNFWYGEIGFLLGMALLMFFIAALVRQETTGRAAWALGVLLILLFFTHMVPFTFALLLLLFFAAHSGRYHLLWQSAPAVALTIWYCIGRFSSGDSDSSAAPTARYSYGLHFWAFKGNTFAKSFGFINPASSDLKVSAAHAVLGSGLYLGTFAVDLLMCAALLLFLVKHGREVGRAHPYLWRAFLVSIPAYLLAPTSFLGIVDPGSRILHTAVFSLLVAAPACERESKSLRAVAGGSVALALAGAFLFARLAWTPEVPRPAHSFPVPVEMLARVPYAQHADQVRLLQQGNTRLAVYETSVLRNRKER